MCQKRRKCVLVTVRQWLYLDFSLSNNFSLDFISQHEETKMLPDLKLAGFCHLVATCSFRHFRSTFYICKSDNEHARANTNCSHPSPQLCYDTAKLTQLSKDHMERRRNTL